MSSPADRATLDRLTRNEADIAFRRRVHTIMRWIPPDPRTRILDVPCGRGFYLERYSYVESSSQMVGVELDQVTLGHASKSSIGGSTPLLQARIESLPFAEDAFDAAICSEVLEHVIDDVAALTEVARVLRPGGTVAITVPHANYPFWWDPVNKTLEAVSGRHVAHGPLAGIWAGHLRLYTRESLLNTVTGAGLEVEEVRSFTHYCPPFAHNLVYGLGKPLLDRGLLPAGLAAAADRHRFHERSPSRWNPVAAAIALARLVDRFNIDDERPDRTTVNLAVKARKPRRP